MARHQQPGRRAEVFFTALAEQPIADLVAVGDEDAVHRLDRALAVLSADPERGVDLGVDLLRDYQDDVEGVRVLYQTTAMRSLLIVAYLTT
ncbi:hypothetical protein [Streptacidiphilus sp. PAMC 29251]